MVKKRVLITGASSGIGKELSYLFAKENYVLILVARDRKKLEMLVEDLESKYKTKALIFVADLSKDGTAEQIFKTLKREKMKIDILVNNAGFGNYGFFEQNSLEKETQLIDVNIKSLMQLTHLFLPDLVEKRGKILNVASVAGFMALPYLANYAASKAYVLSFSEALSEELKGRGVSVSVLCPGPTRTNFQKIAHMHKLSKSDSMSAKAVAEIGYKGLMRGKRVIVTGTGNKMVTTLPKLIPRGIVRRLANHWMKDS